jgi:hypothetical protein
MSVYSWDILLSDVVLNIELILEQTKKKLRNERMIGFATIQLTTDYKIQAVQHICFPTYVEPNFRIKYVVISHTSMAHIHEPQSFQYKTQ